MNLKILFIENIPWLQRVDDYRLVDSRGMTQVMNTTDWKKKITRENFWTLKFLHSLNFFPLLKLSSQLCLMKKFEALFIGEAPDFKRTFESSVLKNFESSSTCMKHEVCAEGKFFLSPFFLFFFITLHLSH